METLLNLAFLYPGTRPLDAVCIWVQTLARHCTEHTVRLIQRPDQYRPGEVVVLITEATLYQRMAISGHMQDLQYMKIPYGILHNNDCGIPPLGKYPSFCWTQSAQKKLTNYKPWLFRQPVFPPLIPYRERRLIVGTFGVVEPKKQTRLMWEWSLQNRVPFWVFGLRIFSQQYADYLLSLVHEGCIVNLYEWTEKIEDLKDMLGLCSHFLFMLPQSKSGSGGSPTSPRYAGFFNRPVVVVDDEDTFSQDGYYVYRSLDEITPGGLACMTPPSYHWGPDAYIKALGEKVLEFHNGHLP